MHALKLMRSGSKCRACMSSSRSMAASQAPPPLAHASIAALYVTRSASTPGPKLPALRRWSTSRATAHSPARAQAERHALSVTTSGARPKSPGMRSRSPRAAAHSPHRAAALTTALTLTTPGFTPREAIESRSSSARGHCPARSSAVRALLNATSSTELRAALEEEAGGLIESKSSRAFSHSPARPQAERHAVKLTRSGSSPAASASWRSSKASFHRPRFSHAVMAALYTSRSGVVCPDLEALRSCRSSSASSALPARAQAEMAAP
mmetsp:Transcript_51132/g.116240  ORF Transcript_51132/g.116240 Transcript_51132/m.116240 type:complete len:266 (-) Transcript_51132:640-1437(-)